MRDTIVHSQAPVPLRSDAKVPLRPGLCDMKMLCAEYAVCVGHQVLGGGTIPVAKKKRDVPFPHSRPMCICNVYLCSNFLITKIK